MKINNNPNMFKSIESNNMKSLEKVKGLENQIPLNFKNNGNLKDVIELSISGKNRSKNLIVSTGEKKTSGLIIKNFKIPVDYGLEGMEMTEKETSTVSNEKSALGTSENRLAGNTRRIDNSRDGINAREIKEDRVEELIEYTRINMLRDSLETRLAQGNTNINVAMHLLR